MNTAPTLRGAVGSSSFRLLQIAGLCLGLAASAHAQLVLMDQIGDADRHLGLSGHASQIFEPGFSQYNCAYVDDFTTYAAVTLTQVDTVFTSWTSATGTAITGYQINIYSSLAAGQSSLTGDIASFTATPAIAGLTTAFGNTSNTFVSIPVSIALPQSGTYFVGVSAIMDLARGGQVYVSALDSATWGLPGGMNAALINPDAGFGSTLVAIEPYDAAYRVIASTGGAVPEPSTTGAVAGAALLALIALRVRRRS